MDEGKKENEEKGTEGPQKEGEGIIGSVGADEVLLVSLTASEGGRSGRWNWRSTSREAAVRQVRAADMVMDRDAEAVDATGVRGMETGEDFLKRISDAVTEKYHSKQAVEGNGHFKRGVRREDSNGKGRGRESRG